MILCNDPLADYRRHKTAVDAAIQRVLDGGYYVLGPEVEAFERDFAAFVGVSHAVGVANGTEALTLALMACGIGPGDEVVTVSFTAVATVAAVDIAGAMPVIADIEPDYYTLDPAALERAITPRTKAVVPVHLYGQPAAVDEISAIAERHGLRVIEDCAQAAGATYRGRRAGALGDVGCFSFYPTKNLGAVGDGGICVTDDPEIAARLRALRQYGWHQDQISESAGRNSRLDEIQAAILNAKLPELDADNADRQAVAGRYDAALAETGLGLPARRPECGHVHHLYVVRSARRDALKSHLAERGIAAGVHYPAPVHLQPAYRGRLADAGSLPETERAAQEVLSLPLHPGLDEAAMQRVVDAVREFVHA